MARKKWLKIPKWSNVRKVAGMASSQVGPALREYRMYPPLGRSWLVRVYDRELRKLNWLNLPGRKRVAKVRFRGNWGKTQKTDSCCISDSCHGVSRNVF